MISIPYNDIEIINKILSDNIKSGKVYAFGSRYKWTNRDFSDLDLAIDINRKMSINEIENLKYDFEESNLSYRVDVIDYNNISKEFKRIIDSGNEIIYNKNGAIMGNNENWQEVRLEKVLSNISETYKGDKKNAILINTSDILNGKVFNHSINTGDIKGQFKKSFQRNDILYSEIRPINKRFAFIDFDSTNYIASTKLMVLRVNIENDTKFIFNILKSNNILTELQTIAELRSGTFPQITFNDLKNIKIKLPPLEEQKKIASILSSLDDKIELNNRMNKILEETAQTIFKEWFVNFNFPNEEGKPYKDSGGKMIESELGAIPEGWEITNLDYIVKVIKGKKPKEISSKKTDLLSSQYLTIDCYNNSNIEYTEYIEKMYVNKLDIIMVMDGASSGKLFYGKNGILSSTMSKFEIEDSNLNEIVFFFLKNLENEIMYHTTGSAIPHANKQFILNKKIVLPPQNMFHIINNLKEIRYKIIINNEENQKLASIRDTILPKLMSGEIHIK